MEKKYEISPNIYTDDIIQSGITDFSEVSTIEYSNGTLVIKGENNEESDEIFREFMNYLLSI